MTFNLNHLKQLGKRVQVIIPKDEEGYLGRECPQPDCEGYFKIKPGTGLIGENLPCHCPYCGHEDAQNNFFTNEQIEYAKSVVLRGVAEAVRKDLKTLEFEHKPRGTFGIGISMKVRAGAPLPIRHYRERELETKITCESCTLQFAVYGLFAYCPDCSAHNSLQILQMNLDLTRRQLDLAEKIDDAPLRQHVIEDALENCVSAFDGFAREACRIRAHKSTDPAKCAALSFQNLHRAATRLRSLFGVDLAGAIAPDIWSAAHIAFMRRHLLAHKAGVVDQQYLDETGESAALLGRRLNFDPTEVCRLADTVMKIGEALISLLPVTG
jgi:hypothetical protein